MHEKIVELLKAHEVEHQVKILFASRVGSRAWGWSTSESDHDIRFIYAHHPDRYLDLDAIKRQTVDEEPYPQVQFHGWDFRYALQLIRKANPMLVDALFCEHIYGNPYVRDELQALMYFYYRPHPMFFFHQEVATRELKRVLRNEGKDIKTALHGLYSLARMYWCNRSTAIPPASVGELLSTTEGTEQLYVAIQEVIIARQTGKTIDVQPLASHALEQALALPIPPGKIETMRSSGPVNTYFRRMHKTHFSHP